MIKGDSSGDGEGVCKPILWYYALMNLLNDQMLLMIEGVLLCWKAISIRTAYMSPMILLHH